MKYTFRLKTAILRCWASFGAYRQRRHVESA